MSIDPIALTGVGAFTPAGATADALWQALLSGVSTARRIDHFDASGHGVRIGCPAGTPEAPEGMSAKEFRRADPFARFALSAAVEAFVHAGRPRTDPARIAVVVGNAVGGRTVSDEESVRFARGGPGAVSPLMPVMTMPNAAAALISIHLGVHGPTHTIATTCASGADAIGHGMSLLHRDLVDVVLAGGCEATLTPVTLAAFSQLGALSGRNDEPQAASRPFDRDRDGFVMGEGAAFVVLERQADARARAADEIATLVGYATTSDAHHLTIPRPDGAGAVAAMRAALRQADVAPADIGHINAHGTSTRLNDATEAAAINEVFLDAPPCTTATKGVTGHLLGASGAAEVVATALSLRHGLVPPVANHATTDPSIHLDVVADRPRPIDRRPALTNSFGFGGHNACLVIA